MTTWRVRGVGLPDGVEVDAGVGADGTWTEHPPPDAEPLPGRYVLPGLVDAHCHLSIGRAPEGGPVGLDLAGARANLERARLAGVTGIRDTGSPGSVSLGLLAEPEGGPGAGAPGAGAPGSRLVVAGRFLAPAGQYFPALHDPVPADDVIDAALAEVAAGARWVKLLGDFPVLGPSGPPWPEPTPTYPLDVVARLVEAVHAAGARVAAHTTTPYASQLIAAGIDSVEHGTSLREDDLVQLAARGAAWTVTLGASVGTRPLADPDRERRRQERRERVAHLLGRAVELGVTVLAGSDSVGSIPGEVALLTELGLAPEAALAAVSTVARRFLGFPPLAEGQPADLVSYDDDPREDPAVLARPVAVVLRGTRIR
jgi:imidazolonepropionase-like amidohydrolase